VACGDTYLNSGSSITVYPIVTTTYYVRAEGSCNNTQCTQVTVPLSCILAAQNITLNGSIAQHQANLIWTVHFDEKVDYIVVERSCNGVSFTEIRSIDVNGFVNGMVIR
ncbi:MAG: hypothetical protein ABI861_05580, partial [Panacibacter sp.]